MTEPFTAVKGGPGRGGSRCPQLHTMAKKRNAAPKGGNKTFASKRTMNPPQGGHAAEAGSNKAFQQHDTTRRLGSFEGTGNHARTGNRGHE